VNNLLTHGAGGGGGGESDLNVCSVLFEYITITLTAPHTRGPADILLYTRAPDATTGEERANDRRARDLRFRTIEQMASYRRNNILYAL